MHKNTCLFKKIKTNIKTFIPKWRWVVFVSPKQLSPTFHTLLNELWKFKMTSGKPRLTAVGRECGRDLRQSAALSETWSYNRQHLCTRSTANISETTAHNISRRPLCRRRSKLTGECLQWSRLHASPYIPPSPLPYFTHPFPWLTMVSVKPESTVSSHLTSWGPSVCCSPLWSIVCTHICTSWGFLPNMILIRCRMLLPFFQT